MKPAIGKIILTVGGSLVGSILVKVTLTTALVLMVTTLARRSRASVRHILLAVCFALLVALPVASVLIPRLISVRSRGEGNVPVHFEATATSVSSATTVNSVAVAGSAASQAATVSPTVLLFFLWIIGTLLFLLPVAAGLWQTRSLRRSGLPWQYGRNIVDELAVGIDVGGPIEVLLHEQVPGPMTCGFVHPAVLLPTNSQNWPLEELRRAAVHELEHVRRGDWISRCIARAICAAYWFHPLVWMALASIGARSRTSLR
jgi:beta-lactamase regulating signal transducer with metallopeptidase domain